MKSRRNLPISKMLILLHKTKPQFLQLIFLPFHYNVAYEEGSFEQSTNGDKCSYEIYELLSLKLQKGKHSNIIHFRKGIFEQDFRNLSQQMHLFVFLISSPLRKYNGYHPLISGIHPRLQPLQLTLLALILQIFNSLKRMHQGNTKSLLVQWLIKTYSIGLQDLLYVKKHLFQKQPQHKSRILPLIFYVSSQEQMLVILETSINPTLLE